MNRLAIAVALVSVACVSESAAAPITISNSGFEGQVLPDANYIITVPTGWTLDFGTMHGVWNPDNSWFPAGLPGESHIAWLHEAGISQTLADVYQPGLEYQLSVYVGRWIDTPPDFTIAFIAGGDTLASLTRSASIIPRNTFSLFTLDLPALSPGDPRLGLPIRIALSSTGREVDFDALSLEANPVPVPEPAAWTLLLAGAALLASHRHRRH